MANNKYSYNLLNALTSPLRSNRFVVTIVDNNGKIEKSDEVESIDIPESAVSTIPLQFDNKTQTLIPYSANYSANTINITFRELEDSSMYKFFYDWINTVIPRNVDKRSYNIPYYDTIVKGSNMTIELLDITGQVLSTVQFNNIYPNNVKLSSLDMNARDDYVKSTVTIVFEEFKYI
jgi:hypothetical protein